MKKFLMVLFIILVGIQFIPVERSNPPVTQDIEPPENISAILRTSCYDCHSNETKWPWYSYIVPISLLIASDVNDGRKHLNFSEWEKYDETKRTRILEEILEEIEKGEMPLSKYTLLHPEAEIDMSKIKSLKDWIINSGSEENQLRYKKNNE